MDARNLNHKLFPLRLNWSLKEGLWLYQLQISEYSSIIEIIEIEGHDEHCDEITDQSECAALDHCEWHTDDNSCEDHEEGHGMSLHIIGVSVGSTSFKLELMHGDHADYTSTNNVPVIVVP